MTHELTTMGPHLMLDCRRCDPAAISDMQTVFAFLDRLPDDIGMTKITQPYVFPYSGLVPEDAGITGTVVIAESHLSFHSFVHKDYFFFDCFSCKPFDVDAVQRKVAETFGVEEMDVHFTLRGRAFPRESVVVAPPSPLIQPATRIPA